MNFIQCADRDEVLLLPERVDEYVDSENPVRFIDAFIDGLDLESLGFSFPRTDTRGRGRPAYPPSALLKLLIYGYVNGIRSGRKLERECSRNLELVWLLGKLRPDFKTICDFRRVNRKAFKAVFREFNLICKKLKLFSGVVVAIDGTKIKGQNNPSKNYTERKLQNHIERIDKAFEQYVRELDRHDSQPVCKEREADLKSKLERLDEKRDECRALLKELETSEESQISKTDPDARSMGRSGRTVCGYNHQIAVDDEHKLIVAEKVTNAVNDQKQLGTMVDSATEELGRAPQSVVADTGYHHEEELAQCETNGYAVHVPEPALSKGAMKGLYQKDQFVYEPTSDSYRCPAGCRLSFKTKERDRRTGKIWRKYGNASACRQCSQRKHCTRSRHRMIRRSPFAESVQRVRERTRGNPQLMRRRKAIVEHPFGTIKTQILNGGFLVRGLEMAGAETALAATAYNLKRVLKIMSIEELLQAVAE